jgi:hypothetical protein
MHMLAALLPAPPLRRRNFAASEGAKAPSHHDAAALHHPAMVLTGHVGPVTCFLDTRALPASSEQLGSLEHHLARPPPLDVVLLALLLPLVALRRANSELFTLALSIVA